MDSSDHIPLKHIDVSGRIDDLMLQGRIAFHFVNTGAAPAEVIYTFPLPHDAIVTGLAVTDAQVARHEADILERQAAEVRYEKTAAVGRSPVILSSSEEDLATLSVGALAPGESLVAEVAFFKLIDVQLDCVRLVFPLTAGDRYSTDGRQGRLLPYEEVKTSMLVEYPVTATFVVDGELASCPIAAPSFHPVIERLARDRTKVTIKNAFADRNLVLAFTSVPPKRVELEADYVFHSRGALLVERHPAEFDVPEKPLWLDILVDASSFMAGTGLQQAREALAALSERLTEDDRVRFMRFGTQPDVVVNTPAPFTDEFRRNVFLPAIEQTEATLGAPDATQALKTIRMQTYAPKGFSDAVLLITTGCLWNDKPFIDAAWSNGRRLFILGVSSHAVEGPLERAAFGSIGLSSIAGVGENLSPVVDRLVWAMRRARQHLYSVALTTPIDMPPISIESRLLVSRCFKSPVGPALISEKTMKAIEKPWQKVTEPILALRLSQAAAFKSCIHSDDAAAALRHRVLTSHTSWLISGLPVND